VFEIVYKDAISKNEKDKDKKISSTQKKTTSAITQQILQKIRKRHENGIQVFVQYFFRSLKHATPASQLFLVFLKLNCENDTLINML